MGSIIFISIVFTEERVLCRFSNRSQGKCSRVVVSYKSFRFVNYSVLSMNIFIRSTNFTVNKINITMFNSGSIKTSSLLLFISSIRIMNSNSFSYLAFSCFIFIVSTSTVTIRGSRSIRSTFCAIFIIITFGTFFVTFFTFSISFFSS